MTNYSSILGSLLIAIIMVSCNTSSTKGGDLKEANAMYEEAMKIEKRVTPLMEDLIQRRNSLSVQGRALSDEEQAFIDQVYAIEDQFRTWKENRVDMPDSNKEEETTASGRSPSQWLRIQKESRDQILGIEAEVTRLTSVSK